MNKVTNTSKNPNPEWLMGGNPNAIEAQEAQGQKEFVNSSQLPVKANGLKGSTAEEQYPKMGIRVIKKSEGDEIFVDVELPKGWKIQDTDHSMWNSLIDDKGRKRASIFYKAAFYDRNSHINFSNRIGFRVDRFAFLENDYSQIDGEYKAYKTPYVGRVTDFDGKILFETEAIKCDVEYIDYNGRKAYSDAYKTKSSEAERELREKCLNFLAEKYPDYENVNAYWD